MKKVLILHGWSGSDFPHWQSHLAIELIKSNYAVSFPSLPSKSSPVLNEWLNYLDEEMKHFKPDIVVCHSLATILWFHYVNNFKIDEIEKLMLVSPVPPTCDVEKLNTFFPYLVPTDLRAKEKIMVCGDNDPYITLDEAYRLHDMLGIGLKVLEGAGHISTADGYGKLDCAYNWVAR
jgi:predicted alpha/beta hydrolase family esterase